MARIFNSATPDYLFCAAPVIGAPFTMMAWVNMPIVGANRAILSLCDTASDNNNFLSYVASDGNAYFFIQSAAGTAQTTAIAYTPNVWQHHCAIEAAANSHALYLNGVVRTNATSRTPASIDRFGVAIRADLTPDMANNGKIAEVAIWNVALDASEVVILAKGYSPLLIRPQSLALYAPLIRGSEDWIGGSSLSANGAPGVYPHVNIFYPGMSSFLSKAGSGSPPEPPGPGGLTTRKQQYVLKLKQPFI